MEILLTGHEARPVLIAADICILQLFVDEMSREAVIREVCKSPPALHPLWWSRR